MLKRSLMNGMFKFYSPSQNAPNVATIAENAELAMNFFPNFSNEVEIPVLIKTPLAGTYELVFDSISNLSATCLTLIDVLTGSETIITDNYVYSFTSTTDYSGVRFYIVNSGTAHATHTDVSCSGESEGSLTLHANGVGLIEYTLVQNGSVIENLTLSTDSLIIDSLSAGHYIWVVEGMTTCGVPFSSTDSISILDGLSFDSSFIVDEDTVDLINSEATITFTNTSTVAGNISWDFGEGQGSTGDFVTHIYQEEGTYEVTMTIDNGSCSETVTTVIVVNAENTSGISELDQNLTIVKNKAEVIITSSSELINSVSLIDINGKLLSVHGGNSNRISIPTKDFAAGIYFFRVSLADGGISVIKWKN